MNSSGSDLGHIDVEKLAEQAQELAGAVPLPSLERLCEMAHADARPGAGDTVSWKARGERRAPRGEGKQTWLHLEARTELALTCQRCLQPLRVAVDVARSFRFVPGEEAAAKLDAESDDDVLASSRSFDLMALLEDELLLSLPLVPRHDDCRMPLPHAVAAFDRLAAADAEEGAVNPFSVLAGLKGGRRGN